MMRTFRELKRSNISGIVMYEGIRVRLDLGQRYGKSKEIALRKRYYAC